MSKKIWENFEETKLYKNWASFLQAFFSPYPLIFLVLSILSIWLSFKYKENMPFSVLVTIIAAFFSGLAGGFIKDEFSSLMLEKKGRSAVRNLESINQQIYKIRGWIKEFVKGKRAKESLKETDRHLSMAEFNIQAGIEDWIDVVPELGIFSKIIRNQETALFIGKEKIASIERELLKVRDNREVKKKLAEQKKQIRNLENTIYKFKKERSSIISSFSLVAPYHFKNLNVNDLEEQIKYLLEQLAELQNELRRLEDKEKK
ncbi:MAG: hypothetical protein IB617_02125 [Candidatus Nealsonbacteria bacterium]|nr:MAG: hypothetical protein IB617_02125 [Candidatus Nealsonbacteria bacterium]